MQRTADRSRLGSSTVYTVVRLALGLVLLLAAGLKAHQLSTGPVGETWLLDSRWFLISVVEFELLFGLWLLAGIHPRLTWKLAVATFAWFTAVSLYLALSGRESCGCMGGVTVNPWYMLAFDTAAVLALLCFRPAPARLTDVARARSRVLAGAGVVAVWLTAGIPLGLAMGSYTPGTLADSGHVLGQSGLVVLEPETWVGKRLPLLAHVDIGDQLAQGEWIVLLYHHDCPSCRDVIARYAQPPNGPPIDETHSRPAERAADSGRPRVALVEVPKHGTVPEQVGFDASCCLMGRLSQTREWFVTTPVELLLEGGVVKRVTVSRDLTSSHE